jgi:octaprenyl-diphosphate synthase
MQGVRLPLESQLSPNLDLIADDMGEVDKLISQRLFTSVPLVSQVSGYIISSGGKRLRPALLLLVCGALGYTGSERFNLAAVIEFIHTATLLHDDVVDESTLRRGRPTANQKFGNPASVLVGDFLYSRAFQMMLSAGSMRIMEILADATNVISEGEVQQLLNTRNLDLDEQGYLKVIRCKTAKLFEASGRLAAVLAGSPAHVEQACADYGQAIGTAFQVIDDVLDYDGKTGEMGKNLGDDLREGKVTLPLIFAMQRSSSSDCELLRRAILDRGDADLAEVISIVRAVGAIESARSVAAQEAKRAIDAVAVFSESPYSGCLLQLAHQLLARRS